MVGVAAGEAARGDERVDDRHGFVGGFDVAFFGVAVFHTFNGGSGFRGFFASFRRRAVGGFFGGKGAADGKGGDEGDGFHAWVSFGYGKGVKVMAFTPVFWLGIAFSGYGALAGRRCRQRCAWSRW